MSRAAKVQTQNNSIDTKWGISSVDRAPKALDGMSRMNKIHLLPSRHLQAGEGTPPATQITLVGHRFTKEAPGQLWEQEGGTRWGWWASQSWLEWESSVYKMLEKWCLAGGHGPRGRFRERDGVLDKPWKTDGVLTVDIKSYFREENQLKPMFWNIIVQS